MKNRKRIGALLAFGLLCLLLLLLGRPSRSTVATQPAAPEPAPPPSPGSFTHHHPAPALEDPPALPVIEAMSVENREVCSGQDNMVTVRLAGAYANDPSIRILMPAASAAGPQMPFSLNLWGGQQPEMPEVSVYGSRGVLATVKIPTVTVKDCTPEPSLSVGVSLEPNTSATYTFTATIRNPGNTPFQAVEWQWDFGDGTDGTTHVRTVEHGYEDRPQKTRMSSFLVHVRAVDAQGMELVGRTGLELRNPAFEALSIKHAIVLSTELNPRFPALASDGKVTERVRVHHAYDKPVTIEKVILQRYRQTPEGREEVQASELRPAQVLATNVIPPGSGVEAVATLDVDADRDVSFLTFELRGRSADGLPAWGQFSVMRPPALIRPDERRPIADARLKAKILATRALLKQDVVTQDDIDRLQREGAFEHLAEEVAMNDDQPSPGAEQQGAAPAKLPRGSTMGRAHPAGR